jgi:hypothetical protein
MPSGREPFVSGHLTVPPFSRNGCDYVSQTVSTTIIFRQTKIHNIGATLVGVDKFGNKYYEKLHDTQYGE